MKKILCIVLAAACLTLTACDSTDETSGNNSAAGTSSTASAAEIKKASEKTAALLEAVEFPEMISANSDFLDVNFGIKADDLEDYSLYICPSGAMPDEFGVFTAKSPEAAADIMAKIEDRIGYQKETYTTYTPDEVYKLDGSVCGINVNENTVYYAICADGAKAKEILG